MREILTFSISGTWLWVHLPMPVAPPAEYGSATRLGLYTAAVAIHLCKLLQVPDFLVYHSCPFVSNAGCRFHCKNGLADGDICTTLLSSELRFPFSFLNHGQLGSLSLPTLQSASFWFQKNMRMETYLCLCFGFLLQIMYTYFPPFRRTLLHPSHSFFTELLTFIPRICCLAKSPLACLFAPLMRND